MFIQKLLYFFYIQRIPLDLNPFGIINSALKVTRAPHSLKCSHNFAIDWNFNENIRKQMGTKKTAEGDESFINK